MKKIYCLIFLLIMPSIYGMQKKNRTQKKFNIHNIQYKNNKKSKNKMQHNRWVKEKLNRNLDKRVCFDDFQDIDPVMASVLMVSSLTPAIFWLECVRTHGASIGCCDLFNWCA